eukprot:scaffold15612_cov26-Attheya_sp.AAC.1
MPPPPGMSSYLNLDLDLGRRFDIDIDIGWWRSGRHALSCPCLVSYSLFSQSYWLGPTVVDHFVCLLPGNGVYRGGFHSISFRCGSVRFGAVRFGSVRCN